MTRFVIGIAGGTGSGKTTLAEVIRKALGDEAVVVAQDAYYRDLGEMRVAQRATVNFDAPEALETERLVADLAGLRRGEAARVPIYDFTTHTRKPETMIVEPVAVVVVEGILVLADTSLREEMDLKVFVDTDADVRLSRRVRRDVDERGRDVGSVLEQYETTVRPMHDAHVEPSKAHADLIVPGDGDMARAAEVIVAHARAAIR